MSLVQVLRTLLVARTLVIEQVAAVQFDFVLVSCRLHFQDYIVCADGFGINNITIINDFVPIMATAVPFVYRRNPCGRVFVLLERYSGDRRFGLTIVSMSVRVGKERRSSCVIVEFLCNSAGGTSFEIGINGLGADLCLVWCSNPCVHTDSEQYQNLKQGYKENPSGYLLF
ncbi:hypothetical protein KCV07_g208, partial [Aureobasidium melanogenum]